jgi:NAD(P)H dehydrogenase (quinone)
MRQSLSPVGRSGLPQRVFIVLAHPERSSFNGAMADAAVETMADLGSEVTVSDLYRMQFDPVSDRRNFTSVKDPHYFKPQVEEAHATEVGGFAEDIDGEIGKVESCDLMIWQFPLWWFSVPGILKGWVDRVFAFDRVYGRGRYYETGKNRGKRALLSLTTGSSANAYLPNGFNGEIGAILRPIHRGMLQFVGFDVLRPQVVWQPSHLDEADRRAALDAWKRRLVHVAAETPIDVGRY